MKIVLITGNAGKAEEVSRYLKIPIEHQSLDLNEIQSLDLEEIVKDKASRAFKEIGKPVLVEDVSFTFHSLGKLPGPLIKWFQKELENEGLCRLIDGKDRSCKQRCVTDFMMGKRSAFLVVLCWGRLLILHAVIIVLGGHQYLFRKDTKKHMPSFQMKSKVWLPCVARP